MKRAFKRPQTIVYRACRIVAMRLTYTSAQDFATVLQVRVSRRPLTEFTPLVPYFACWSWARRKSLEEGAKKKTFCAGKIGSGDVGFVKRSTSSQVWNDSRQVSALFWAKLIYFWRGR